MIPSNPLLIPSLVAADKRPLSTAPGPDLLCLAADWVSVVGHIHEGGWAGAVNPAGQDGGVGPLFATPPTPPQPGGGLREKEKLQNHSTGSCHVFPSLAESWGCYSISLADGSLPTWLGYPQRPNLVVSSEVKSPMSLSFSCTNTHPHTLPANVSCHPATLRKSLYSFHPSRLPTPLPISAAACMGRALTCERHDPANAMWRLALQLPPTFANGLTFLELCPLCCILGNRLLPHPRRDGFGLSLPTHCPASALSAPRETSILFPTCCHREPLGSYSTSVQARV